MKKLALGLLAVAVLLAGSTVPSSAEWHGGWHGHWHARPVWFGPRIVVGAPVFVGPPVYYPRPYVYAPPPVVVTSPPPVYVQDQQFWYYCQNPAGYYPSVAQCPGGWQQVTPQSPPQ